MLLSYIPTLRRSRKSTTDPNQPLNRINLSTSASHPLVSAPAHSRISLGLSFPTVVILIFPFSFLLSALLFPPPGAIDW